MPFLNASTKHRDIWGNIPISIQNESCLTNHMAIVTKMFWERDRHDFLAALKYYSVIVYECTKVNRLQMGHNIVIINNIFIFESNTCVFLKIHDLFEWVIK